MKRLAIQFALCMTLGLTSCVDLSQRWELDHARLLAVKLDVPALAPGQQATLTAVVVDDDGVASEIAPTVALVASQDPILAKTIAIQPGTWKVVAGSTESIAAARAALQIPADQPVRVQVGARFSFAGVERDAVKEVLLGEGPPPNPPPQNPVAPVLLLAGQPMTAASTAKIGDKVNFSFGNSTELADPMLSVQWAISTGKLTKSETNAATLELTTDSKIGPANIVVVIRNSIGGVSWSSAQLQITP
jgi:hypothetical protein